MTGPILCLGDACMDVLLPCDDVRQGRPRQPLAVCGGAVANTAAGLGRLGADCAFCGTAGDDTYGRTMRRVLFDSGVDVSHFTLCPELNSTLVLVCLEQGGERIPFLLPQEKQAYLQLPTLSDEALRRFSLVHTTGMMLYDEPSASVILHTLERCHALGIPVSLDLNTRVESLEKSGTLLRMALPYVRYLLGSEEDELIPLTAHSDVRELVTEQRTVISRQGAGGATVYSADGASHCPAFPVQVTDTVGAGDCYNSGFLYALNLGLSPAEANRYGCAAAAISLQSSGARSGPDANALINMLNSEKNVKNREEFT